MQVRLTVVLTLSGPILTQATAPGALGIDAPMARNKDGKFYLPYSLVRGRLRQSWKELNEAGMTPQANLHDWLGPEPPESGGENARSYTPERGRLRFTDFITASPPREPDLIYRIRMDPARGAAVQGAVQIMESPFGSGELVEFLGEIGFFAENAPAAELILTSLSHGLRWITSFGAERTSGFGKLQNVSVVRQACSVPAAPLQVSITAERVSLRIYPRSAFCVAKRRTSENLFESDIVLSGGVLKGALASTLKTLAGLGRDMPIDRTFPAPWQELGLHFDDLHFTHAFPSGGNQHSRPVFPPLSLVKGEGKVGKGWYDVALCHGPFLLGSALQAPAFCVDWKDDTDIRSHFGWPSLVRLLRVRTAIDREKRRAQEQRLFAYEMVEPGACIWRAQLDLGRIADPTARATVLKQLQELLRDGLHNIGKTKSLADVVLEATAPPTTEIKPTGDLWVVTLQTPALLCNPRDLRMASGERELKAAYSQIWKELSDDSLELVRFFAGQSLAGGYLVYRFQRGDGRYPKPYNPFLLTDAGSVFVLKEKGGNPAKVSSILQRWLRYGLPLPAWAQTQYGETWKTCPFCPADGFGEIALNLPCHTQDRPLEEPFHAF